MKPKKNRITHYDDYWKKAGNQDLFGMIFVIGAIVLAGAGLIAFISGAPYQN